MKMYKFSKEQIKELKDMEFSVEVIGVGNTQINYYADIVETLEHFTLEEIINPLERGDKVRFKDFNASIWSFGWFIEAKSDCYNEKYYNVYTASSLIANWSVCEPYEWTEADLIPDALKEGK